MAETADFPEFAPNVATVRADRADILASFKILTAASGPLEVEAQEGLTGAHLSPPWLGYTLLIVYLLLTAAVVYLFGHALKFSDSVARHIWLSSWFTCVLTTSLAAMAATLIGIGIEKRRKIIAANPAQNPFGAISLFLMSVGIASGLTIFGAHEIFAFFSDPLTFGSSGGLVRRLALSGLGWQASEASQQIALPLCFLGACLVSAGLSLTVAVRTADLVSNENIGIKRKLKLVNADKAAPLNGPDTTEEQILIETDIAHKRADIERLSAAEPHLDRLLAELTAVDRLLKENLEVASRYGHIGADLNAISPSQSREAVVSSISNTLDAIAQANAALKALSMRVNSEVDRLFSELQGSLSIGAEHIALAREESVVGITSAVHRLNAEIIHLQWQLDDAKRRDRLPLLPIVRAQTELSFQDDVIALGHNRSNGLYKLEQDVEDRNNYFGLAVATVAFLTINLFLIAPPSNATVNSAWKIYMAVALTVPQASCFFLLLRDYAVSLRGLSQGGLNHWLSPKSLAYFGLLLGVGIAAFYLF